MLTEQVGLLRRFRRALVTGGAGFIGSHLVDALVRHDLAVTVLDDLSTGTRDNLPDGVELIEADVASPKVADLFAGVRPDLVIHAAAQISVPASVQDPARDRDVNLLGTEHVIRGAQEAGASRLVFISSGGAIYGDASGATEQTLPAPQNPYGVHKLAAESYVRLSGLAHGIVRYSNVYGPRQRPGLEGGVVAIFLDACRSDGKVTIFGDGRQSRDFLHVDDAVGGTLAVAAASVSGTWNVATGRSHSVLDLLQRIEDVTGRRCEVTYAPRRPGDVAMSSLDISRIHADLEWAPSLRLRDGLEATLLMMDATS
jgi:UDP-glucose 4-epimerase